MDIPINAKVMCSDGGCGTLVCVIVNPVNEQITHVVVREKGLPQTERLVPIDQVHESEQDHILLSCTQDDLVNFPTFVDTEFLPTPLTNPSMAPSMLWPYAVSDMSFITLEHERIPPGELAIHRGSRVEAIDGHIGSVDEFLVEPESGHITHLILREGHFWGKKDISIPVSQIDHIEEDKVYLKLNKHSIENLQSIPMNR
jgi:sporulation protein YlmC with PRC-barrel domain